LRLDFGFAVLAACCLGLSLDGGSDEFPEFMPGGRLSSSSLLTNIRRQTRATGPLLSHANCGKQRGLISVPSLIREEFPNSPN